VAAAPERHRDPSARGGRAELPADAAGDARHAKRARRHLLHQQAVRPDHRARIGANAVVLDDVPPGALAVGIPARVVPARSGSAAAGAGP
jgi:hypothetical protein